MGWERAGLLAAGGAALLALAACGANNRSTDTRSYEVTDATARLVVDDLAGKVTVTTGDGPVRVTEKLVYGRHKPTMAHTSTAGTVHLTAGSCLAVFDRGCEVDYEVRVPAGTAVEVRADAGDVSVTGLAGDLRVTARAGKVTATDLRSAHTTVQADAGEVALRYRAAPSTVDVNAIAGDIAIGVPGDTSYAVDASTTAGDHAVGVPTAAGSGHRITAHAAAGSVRVNPA